MAGGTQRGRAGHPPLLPGEHPGAGPGVGHSHRQRAGHRLHAYPPPPPPGLPGRGGPGRKRGDGDGAGGPLRVRLPGPLGGEDGQWHPGGGRGGRGGPGQPGAPAGRAPAPPRQLRGPGGRGPRLSFAVGALLRGASPPAGRPRSAGQHPFVLGGLVRRPQPGPRRVGGAGTAQPPHPEGTDLRPQRGHSGGAHHFPARAAGWEPQLGLPLLLGPGRHLDPGRPRRSRLPRRGRGVAVVVGAGGAPAQLQVVYGVAGERRLPELEVDWLPGYEASRPVRIGNAASLQFQLDVFGELMEAVDRARSHGVVADGAIWDLQRALLGFVEEHWDEPDQGIWELRGPPRPLVYSRVMAWVALDRGVKAVESYGLPGPAPRWREARDAVREQVCSQGFNPRVGAFVQSYGSDELDASLLMVPLVGFLPVDDPRVVGTIEAVQRELMVDGFVARYRATSGVDGLGDEAGTFMPCSLWLVSGLALLGRVEEAGQIFERVVAVANDVGLLSEEYYTGRRRLVGNFPQAFTHVALVNAARHLAVATARGASAPSAPAHPG